MQYTPGQRVIIRDAEWTIRKVEILADDGYELVCDGFSNFIKGKDAIFLTSGGMLRGSSFLLQKSIK
jgi:hypothetical protein